jgi:RNA polymerase sigma factor (sigma-70 family)
MALEDDIKKIHETKEKLREVLGREPLDEELAYELNFTVEKIQQLMLLKLEEYDDSNESHNLRFKLTIKNHEMEKARELLNLRQIDLAVLTKIGSATLGQIECCRYYPDKDRQEIIAKALNSTPQKLFPKWLQAFSEKWNRQQKSRIVPINELSLSDPVILMLEDGTYESMIRKEDNDLFRARLDKISLSPRDRDIINLRYGFKDGSCYTYEEIAQQYNVTRERIRQQEARILEKLRYSKGLFSKEREIEVELKDIRSRKDYNLEEY